MVYRGRPSKGCLECRKRKIRCDQRKDGCENCSKAKRECSGYRDELDLLFTDESAHVVRRAKTKAENAKSQLNRSSSSGSETPKPDNALQKSSRSNCYSPLWQLENADGSLSLLNPSPDYDERGTNFFFTYYIIGMDHASAIAPHTSDFASSIVDDTLIASIRALGLASFAGFNRSSDIQKQADARYLESVQLTNVALRDPHLVKRDSTLLAVLLLSQYEAVCGDTRGSIKDWANHVNGAAALVRLRGLEQLETRAGLRMFVQAMVNSVIAWMQEDEELPNWMSDLREAAGQYLDPSELNWRFHDLAIKYMKLHKQVKRKDFDDPVAALWNAIDLDREFEQAFINDDASSLSGFRVVQDDDPDYDLVFGNTFHVYNDFLYASTWNSMRTLRIILNEHIRNIIQDGWLAAMPFLTDERYLHLHETAITNLYSLQADILATVPQHMGYHKAAVARNSSSTNGPSPYRFLWSAFPNQGCSPFRHDYVFHPIHPEISTLPATRMSGGNFLPWHLHLVGTMDISTREIVEWTSNILRKIGNEMSIKQSLVFGQQIIDSLRITHKGKDFPSYKLVKGPHKIDLPTYDCAANVHNGV